MVWNDDKISRLLYFYFSLQVCVPGLDTTQCNAFLTGAESDAAIAKSFCCFYALCLFYAVVTGGKITSVCSKKARPLL
jgi:hypothetical protein